MKPLPQERKQKTGEAMKAPKKKTSRKTLRNKCDKLWGQAVRLRDKGVCQYEYCGKPANNPHHIFTKGGHPVTRHDLDNGITLCAGHHLGTAHGKPQLFEKFVQKRMGQKKYDLLMVRAYGSGKNDLELKKIELETYIKRLEG